MKYHNSQLSLPEIEARSKIGRRIVYWALIAISVLGLGAIITVTLEPENVTPIKDILAMILPMIGAWVGTVLAFYFSRENYIAAAESSAQMIGLTLEQHMESISIQDLMLPIGEVENKYKLDADESTVKLKDDLLQNTAEKSKMNRILILGSDEVVKYVIHRSIIDQFIVKFDSSHGRDSGEPTLKDLLEDKFCSAFAISFGTIGRTGKLDAAKAIMDSHPSCADVIVTENGRRESKAVGWITNAMILERLHA